MYLIDTNVLSEARRGTPVATTWLRSVDPLGVYLSVMTLGEVSRGIVKKERSDIRAASALAEWLQAIRREYADRVLDINDRIAIEWGRLSAQRPRGDADALIAATAIVHDLVIVTRNVADFVDTGVSTIDPWAL